MLTYIKIIKSLLPIIFLLSCNQSLNIKKSEPIFFCKNNANVKTGLDILLENHVDKIYGKNIAIVTNNSGIDKNGKSNITQLNKKVTVQIEKIFTPEHGFTGSIPAGEIVDNDSISLKISSIISLYGKIKKPTREMLASVDIIIYDIQDIGARFYTYISTLGLVMEAAGEANIPVIVLDRPNPIGGKIEGPLINEEFKSFIGMYSIPIKYGMTIGELAKMIIGENFIESTTELTVIPMENYSRNLYYDETNLLWTNPSPNITDLETAIIYPGFCLFEATNVSEGRGTYYPFKYIGAPWIDADSLTNFLKKQYLPGVYFTPIQFTPKSIATMSKYPKFENQICNGIEINITDRDNYKSVLTGVMVLWAINKLYPNELRINKESMGRLWGSDQLIRQLSKGRNPFEIVDSYQTELEQFLQIRKKYLIYN